MLSKDKKKEIIKGLLDKFKKQKVVVFFDYTGLKVNQFHQLRRQLKKEGIDCQAVKKTLFNLALDKAGFKDLKIKELAGQLAAAFGYQDEIAPAKILYNFTKRNEDVKILAGLVNGEYLKEEAMVSLAKLPGKQELLAMTVGHLAAPLSGLVNALRFNLIKLIYLLKNLEQKA